MAYGNWNRIQAQQWAEFVWTHLHYAEMSVGYLAFAVGVPVETVGQWLDGNQQPSAADCLAIAHVLGANGNRLLELAGHRPKAEGSSCQNFAA